MTVTTNYATQLTAAITAINAQISTVGALAVDSPVVLNTVYQTVQNNLIPFQNAIAAFDADIDTTSIGSVVSGQVALVNAAALRNQAFDVAQQAILIVAQAYVSRVGINILNAPG